MGRILALWSILALGLTLALWRVLALWRILALGWILALGRILALGWILALWRILALMSIPRFRVLEGSLARTLIDVEPALVLLISPGNPRLREGRTL